MRFNYFLISWITFISILYLGSNLLLPTAGSQILLSNGVQFSVGLFSFYWLFRVYRQQATRLKPFWLLLSAGVLFSTIGTAAWFYLTLLQQEINTPIISNFIWVFSYACYLSAMIYKIRSSVVDFSNRSYFFNTNGYGSHLRGVSSMGNRLP